MNEIEEKKIKQFVKDFFYDCILYFTGEELNRQQEHQFELNFKKKFDYFIKEGKYK